MSLTIQDVLDLEPCNDAATWLNTQTDAKSAWETCERGDWMSWLLMEAELLTTEQDLAIQLLALEMPLHDGRKVLDLITDERSLAFIDLKRRKLAGETISDEEWRAAYVAAARAAYAAYAAAYATRAAYATADAAYAAAYATAYAAYATADAAYAAAYATADAAYAAANAWLADELRKMFPELPQA